MGAHPYLRKSIILINAQAFIRIFKVYNETLKRSSVLFDIYYYTLIHSLTEIQPHRKVHVHGKCLHPDHAIVLLSLFINLSCKIKNLTKLPLDLKTHNFDI